MKQNKYFQSAYFLFSLIPIENWKKKFSKNFCFKKNSKNKTKNFCHEYSFCLVAGNTHRIFAKKKFDMIMMFMETSKHATRYIQWLLFVSSGRK